MSSMMQPISSLISSAAQSPTEAAGVKEKVQRPEDEILVRSPKPEMDEYVPEEKQEPSGRYWLGKDQNGQPKIYFDGPKRTSADGKAESCTCSTDQVDQEIEKLKKKQEELEQQIGVQADDSKIKKLEKKLAQTERELSQKDNDAYRRQHAVFS